jgi:branched-chain amino acid transport system permease protein
MGSYFGAAFLWILPILMRAWLPALGLDIGAETVTQITQMVVGALIIFFLITEPHGLARLWAIGKEKLRTWPFPYA